MYRYHHHLQRAGAALVLFVVGLAACSGSDATNPTSAVTAPPTTEAAGSTATTPTSDVEEPTVTTPINTDVLPEREGPRRQTTGSVPHIQTDAEPFPAVDAELRRRAFSLPGVEDLPSAVSLPGARGLSLSADVPIVQQGVIPAGREFAHFHPDGSLHVWLPLDRAREVDDTKWGEIHPWADRDGFWNGTVMVYVPESTEQAEIVLRIIVDAYNFITGSSLSSTDLP